MSRSRDADTWIDQAPELELRLVAAGLEDPAAIDAARAVLSASDFADAFLGRSWHTLSTLPTGGPDEKVDARVLRVAQVLEAQGTGDDTVSRLAQVVNEGADASAFTVTGVLRMARLLRSRRVRDELRLAAAELQGDASESALQKVAGLGAALRELEQPDHGPTYFHLGLHGEAALEASSTANPAPVVENLLWPGHLNVLAGAPKIGKTFLVVAVMHALARGDRPWPGSPTCPFGRVLLLSNDDTGAEITRRFRILDPVDTRWSTAHTIVGKEFEPAPLDRSGLLAIERALDAAREAEQPFAGVVIDPISLFMPDGADIDRERDARPVLQAIERLCLRHGIWAWVIHHVRKGPSDAKAAQQATDDDQAIFDAIAGSAAFQRVPRALAVFSRPQPHLRRVSPRSNVGPSRPFELEVCPTDAHEIRYFRRSDPAALEVLGLFAPTETFSFTEYARRLAGVPIGKEPGHAAKNRAYPSWQRALDTGAVVFDHARGRVKQYRLAIPSAIGHPSATRSATPAGPSATGGGTTYPHHRVADGTPAITTADGSGHGPLPPAPLGEEELW